MTATQGLQMIRKLGRFAEFSVFGQDTTVDWTLIGDRKELDGPRTAIKRSANGRLRWPQIVGDAPLPTVAGLGP